MDNTETLMQLSGIIEAQNQIILRQELELQQFHAVVREERGDENATPHP